MTERIESEEREVTKDVRYQDFAEITLDRINKYHVSVLTVKGYFVFKARYMTPGRALFLCPQRSSAGPSTTEVPADQGASEVLFYAEKE